MSFEPANCFDVAFLRVGTLRPLSTTDFEVFTNRIPKCNVPHFRLPVLLPKGRLSIWEELRSYLSILLGVCCSSSVCPDVRSALCNLRSSRPQRGHDETSWQPHLRLASRRLRLAGHAVRLGNQLHVPLESDSTILVIIPCSVGLNTFIGHKPAQCVWCGAVAGGSWTSIVDHADLPERFQVAE